MSRACSTCSSLSRYRPSPLYGPVRDPNYIVGPGPDTPVIFGGVLEIIVALACIGTAVVLYPVVRRQNAAALGFVGVRVLEASTIFLCVVCLLSVVTLRQPESEQMGCSQGLHQRHRHECQRLPWLGRACPW